MLRSDIRWRCIDFAKTFDKVPHRRLLHKLDSYGIRVHPQVDQLVALWVHSTKSFRCSSLRSSPSIIRCTPGSVLGPIMFLIFINDLPDNSPVRGRLCLV